VQYNLTITAKLTSVSTFHFYANSALPTEKRKELSLSAYPHFIDTIVHFDNIVKKKKKPLSQKLKRRHSTALTKKQ
jgi:hypothetical protein